MWQKSFVLRMLFLNLIIGLRNSAPTTKSFKWSSLLQSARSFSESTNVDLLNPLLITAYEFISFCNFLTISPVLKSSGEWGATRIIFLINS